MRAATQGLVDRALCLPASAAAWYSDAAAINRQLVATLGTNLLRAPLPLAWTCIVDLAQAWASVLERVLRQGEAIISKGVLAKTCGPFQLRTWRPPVRADGASQAVRQELHLATFGWWELVPLHVPTS